MNDSRHTHECVMPYLASNAPAIIVACTQCVHVHNVCMYTMCACTQCVHVHNVCVTCMLTPPQRVRTVF